MYHHATVTYVRDGEGGKKVKFLGDIYKLCNDNGSANDMDACTVPIFDESADKDKENYNTVNGLTV